MPRKRETQGAQLCQSLKVYGGPQRWRVGLGKRDC